MTDEEQIQREQNRIEGVKADIERLMEMAIRPPRENGGPAVSFGATLLAAKLWTLLNTPKDEGNTEEDTSKNPG